MQYACVVRRVRSLILVGTLVVPVVAGAQVRGAPGMTVIMAPPPGTTERGLLALRLSHGRGDTLRWTETSWRQMYISRFANPFAALLQSADSLKLQDTQADAIAVINRDWTRGMTDIWTAQGRRFVALPTQPDVDAAWREVAGSYDRSVALLVSIVPRMPALTAEQRAKLPPWVRGSLDTACIRKQYPPLSPTAVAPRSSTRPAPC
jgi:hypothetical protein